MAPLPPPWGAYPAGEAFPALRALVHSGGRGRAFPDVGAQEFLLAEALAAGQAGEGLLSSVGSGVNRQVAPLEGGENSRQLFTGTFCVRHYYRVFLSPPKMSARLRKVAARAVGLPVSSQRVPQPRGGGGRRAQLREGKDHASPSRAHVFADPPPALFAVSCVSQGPTELADKHTEFQLRGHVGLEAHEAPTCLRLPDRMTTNLHVE